MPTMPSVLISDFDGTMTSRDFYSLVSEQLLTPETPDYWAQYQNGETTHFEALRNIFAAVPAGEDAFAELAQQTGLDPDLPTQVKALRDAGWEVIVVSAGCRWYIEKLLTQQGLDLPIHASPGRIEQGRLIMELPSDSPYLSVQTGIDKAAAVRAALARGARVAYAGDGPVDLKPALLVPPQLRFARDSLAQALRDQGERFRPFERWSDIAQALLAEPRA